MCRALQLMIGLVLVVAIALIFIMPAYQLLPSTLRAWQIARIIASGLSMLVLIAFCARQARRFRDDRDAESLTASPDLLDLTCTRLC